MNTLYSPSLGETFRGPKATINPQASVSGRTHTESAHTHISYSRTSLRDISSRAQKVATRVAAEQSLQGLSTSSNERAAPVVRVISTFSDEIDINEEEDALRSTSKVPALLKVNLDLLLYRSRLARIKAQLTLDAEERRTLLKQAEDGLRRCITMDNSDARTYVVLGKLLMQQKRFDEARQLFAEGSRNTDNTNSFIWSSWGYLESITGNVARARKLFDAAIVVDETHACAWHNWGMLEKNQGNYLRARDLWQTGIQKCRRVSQRSNSHLYCSLAVMAAELGRTSEARQWFEEGTRSNEGASSVALWQAWAVMESRQGDPSAVRYLFKKALQANPKARYVHLAWALWERKLGNTRQCLQLLKRGQALNPTDAAIYQAWGIVEKEQGRPDKAKLLFEAGLRADPYHIHLWQAWGVMEFEQGNCDRARQLFQEGVWADPGSRDTVFIFHAWALLEYRQRNYQVARELFKAALKVDPRNDVVWETWISMEDELGAADTANELRVRRAEKQWEFVIPANFTTRPETPLDSLLSTLNTFFKQRMTAAGSSSRSADSSRSPSRSLRELLPEDYIADMQLEDILSGMPENPAEAALQRLPSPGVKLEERPSLAFGSSSSSNGSSSPSGPSRASSSALGLQAGSGRFTRPAPRVVSRGGTSSTAGSTGVERLDQASAAGPSSSTQQAAAAEGVGDPDARLAPSGPMASSSSSSPVFGGDEQQEVSSDSSSNLQAAEREADVVYAGKS